MFAKSTRRTTGRSYSNLSSLNFRRHSDASKIEPLFVGIMCFAANCLSFVVLEIGTRSPIGNTVTKSAAFNALFRRSYRLRINVFATDIFAGFVATIMVAIGDKYGIPYLYVPWLVNTMNGLTLREGPALFNLAHALLANAGVAALSFMFLVLLLYVEELCVWTNVFVSFQRCWTCYKDRNAYLTGASEVELSNGNVKRLPRRDEGENFRQDFERNGRPRKSTDSRVKIDHHLSVESAVRCIKSTTDGRNHLGRTRFTSVTG